MSNPKPSIVGVCLLVPLVLLLWQFYLPSIEALASTPEGYMYHSRRYAIQFSASIASTLMIPSQAPATTIASSSSADDAANQLLALIPVMKYDAPATNATISKELSQEIEAMAESLENQQSNNAQSPLLQGNWKLLYSNGAEITSLATNLPLGFQLGKTTQPVGVDVFENWGTLEHPLGLAHWQTNVVGSIRVAPVGSLNAVGVVNNRNNRVDVDFVVLVFILDEILGKKVQLRKTLIPKAVPPGQAQPANDITYLDKTVRIVRGGDGALFIFQRDNEDFQYLLTSQERETLLKEAQARGNSAEVDVGIGVAEKSSSPELQFLFQERNNNNNNGGGRKQ